MVVVDCGDVVGVEGFGVFGVDVGDDFFVGEAGNAEEKGFNLEGREGGVVEIVVEG